MTLSTLGTYPFVPLVIILPSVSIDLKPALDFGIASCVTTPCCSMALRHGILGNRPTRIASGFTRPLAVLLAEDTR
jgi:osomolarity two-component system sensor histidine kinase NIK1